MADVEQKCAEERFLDLSEINQRLGFSVESHRLQITAHCDEFQKSGTCKKKAGAG
jgi:hypothetical protein